MKTSEQKKVKLTEIEELEDKMNKMDKLFLTDRIKDLCKIGKNPVLTTELKRLGLYSKVGKEIVEELKQYKGSHNSHVERNTLVTYETPTTLKIPDMKKIYSHK